MREEEGEESQDEGLLGSTVPSQESLCQPSQGTETTGAHVPTLDLDVMPARVPVTWERGWLSQSCR